MKAIQQFSVSTISSVTLYSPPLTSLILSIIICLQSNNIFSEQYKKYNKLQNASLHFAADDRPQILYIRKEENQPYSQKVMYFETSITKDRFIPDKHKLQDDINISLISNYCVDQDDSFDISYHQNTFREICKEMLFFALCMTSVNIIILGNIRNMSIPDQKPGLWLLLIYVFNQSFGNVLAQFGKHIDPAIQILFVNISLIPLATLLSIQQIQEPGFQLINLSPSNKTLSELPYIQYIIVVFTIILIGQCGQLLSQYKKIKFFQKNSPLIQQRLIYVPTICKLIIDISCQQNKIDYVQLFGLGLLIIICSCQLLAIYIQYKREINRQSNQYDDFTQI